MGVPTKVISSSIPFQDGAGNVVANGTLRLQLTQNATVTSGGGQVTTEPIFFILDSTGKIPANSVCWFNDELTPSGTAYHATLVAKNGCRTIVDYGNWVLAGASVDVSTIAASATTVSYSNAVLTNPTGNQAIATGNLSLSAGNLDVSAGTITAENAGTFTNAASNAYARSNVGALDFNAEITAWGNGLILDAVDGGVLIPNTSTKPQVNGIAGYINNSSTTSAGVGAWGGGRALANSVKVWGGISQAQDVAGLTTGVELNGHEVDVTTVNASTAYASVTGMPVVIGSGSHSGTFGDAVVASTNKSTAFWGNGFRSAHGSAITAFYAGKAAASGASASQPISFVANDGSSDFTSSISLNNAVDWNIPIGKTGRNILIRNFAATSNLIQINDGAITNFSNVSGTNIFSVNHAATDLANLIGGGSAPGIRISASNGGTGTNGVVIIANNHTDDTETARFTTSTKTLEIGRVRADKGSSLVTGDIGTISAGWGTTATCSAVTGKDQAGTISMASSGTGQGANPTFVLTFHDGTWTTAPIITAIRTENGAPSGGIVASCTATAATFTFLGTPVAGTTYVISFICMGV